MIIALPQGPVQQFSGRAADSNGDHVVNDADNNIWRAHFGQTAGSSSGADSLIATRTGSAIVPEPSPAYLLVIGGVALAGGRRRRAPPSGWVGQVFCI